MARAHGNTRVLGPAAGHRWHFRTVRVVDGNLKRISVLYYFSQHDQHARALKVNRKSFGRVHVQLILLGVRNIRIRVCYGVHGVDQLDFHYYYICSVCAHTCVGVRRNFIRLADPSHSPPPRVCVCVCESTYTDCCYRRILWNTSPMDSFMYFPGLAVRKHLGKDFFIKTQHPCTSRQYASLHVQYRMYGWRYVCSFTRRIQIENGVKSLQFAFVMPVDVVVIHGFFLCMPVRFHVY